jgi:hypothetical protein
MMNEDLKQLHLNKLYFFYMYTINMADSTGLFIVLIIFCLISISSSVLLTFTCTNGTWDFDNFEGSNCVKLPVANVFVPACSTFTSLSDCPLDCSWDTTTSSCGEYGGGGGGGGGSESVDPNSLTNSQYYTLCSGALVANDAKTCWNQSDNSAGVRWTWSQAQEKLICQQHATTYRIVVSSSQDEHVAKYYYDKNISSSNSFLFRNAPTGWLYGQNVKFLVSALTADNQRVITPFTVELDAGESTDNCAEIGAGNPIEFEDMILMPPPTVAPPPPPPKDCTGVEWVLDEEYGCLSDGLPVDKTACGPSCMEKFVRGADYKEAEFGGNCVLEKYETFKRNSCSETVVDSALDCTWSAWTPAPLANGPEIYSALLDPVSPALGSCTKSCGGGTQRQAQYVSTDDENIDTGEVCGNKFRYVSCNQSPCPIDCKGSWSFTTWAPVAGMHAGGYQEATRTGTYIIGEPPKNSTGKACPHTHGATKTENTCGDGDSPTCNDANQSHFKCCDKGKNAGYDCNKESSDGSCSSMPWAT